MDKSTLFIGLTEKAQNFVKRLKQIKSTQIVEGVCCEEFNLCCWENDKYIFYEEVQEEIWDNGTIIFTHIKMTPKYYNDNEKFHSSHYIFSWVKDPTCKTVFNSKKGIFWIE